MDRNIVLELRIEREELEDKLNDLIKFKETKTFEGQNSESKRAMGEQITAMEAYISALTKRIVNFK